MIFWAAYALIFVQLGLMISGYWMVAERSVQVGVSVVAITGVGLMLAAILCGLESR